MLRIAMANLASGRQAVTAARNRPYGEPPRIRSTTCSWRHKKVQPAGHL